jgi:hypothetical protein
MTDKTALAAPLSYTHFWATGPDNVEGKKWSAFCKDARVLFDQFPHLVYNDQEVIISYGPKREVSFLAPRAGEFGFFSISYSQAAFCFCRTDRQPFDLLVKSLLLSAKSHFGDWITLTSDGSWEDWQDAVDVCRTYLDVKDPDFAAAKHDFDVLLIPRPGKD